MTEIFNLMGGKYCSNFVFGVIQDDAKIRENRLALLKGIAELPKGIADLTVLPGF